MSVAAQLASRHWTRIHRAALSIAILSLALAACLGLLLAARLAPRPAPVPASSVSTGGVQPTSIGCESARRWGKC